MKEEGKQSPHLSQTSNIESDDYDKRLVAEESVRIISTLTRQRRVNTSSRRILRYRQNNEKFATNGTSDFGLWSQSLFLV